MKEKILDASKYPVVVHGTYLNCWESIKKSGLNKMKRNHIHFAIGYPGD
jgi:RNA:NAD 2'-phosphotransferase (TPT1/KptA family)